MAYSTNTPHNKALQADAMKDPRNSRFYKLRKRGPAQLTVQEARDVQAICERMMAYVSNGKTRKEWEKLAEAYSAAASRLREDAP